MPSNLPDWPWLFATAIDWDDRDRETSAKKSSKLLDTELSEKTYLGKGGKEVKMSKKYKDSIDEFMGA